MDWGWSPGGQEQLEERCTHSFEKGVLVRPEKNQASGVLGRSADRVLEEGVMIPRVRVQGG